MVEVSIIIPVYNVEKYLHQCLDSIAKQTFSNFEVICINDGSTDNSLSILNEYAEKDERFIVISQENQGQGVARNVGIDLAKGEYIQFIDSDDFIELNTLEYLYNEFKKTDADIIQFDYATCRENGAFRRVKSYKKKMLKKFNYSIKHNEIFTWKNIKKKNLSEMSLCVWDKAYKKDLIKKNNIKFAPNKHGEDHIFSISANLLANNILYLNKIFYHYRNRLGSSVNKASDDNFCIFENIELIKKFLVYNNLFDEYKTSFEEYRIIVLSWHYSNISTTSIDKYLNKCKTILTVNDYKKFKEKTKGDFSILENIFSLKNQKINGIKFKVIKILGIPLKFNFNKTLGDI